MVFVLVNSKDGLTKESHLAIDGLRASAHPIVLTYMTHVITVAIKQFLTKSDEAWVQDLP
jgi:hypothetical protein